jgi:hypothetical protein
MGGSKGLETTLHVSNSDAAGYSSRRTQSVSDLTAEVLASLKSLGYAHIRQSHTYEEFEEIAQQFGSITLRTDLAITPARSSIVYKPDEIRLHQDNPTMNVLAWYCVRQDQLDGSVQLLDAGDVCDHFSADEIAIMKTIRIGYPDPDPTRHNPDQGLIAHLLWPLLREKATRTEVYYAPWLLIDTYDEQQRRLLEKFAEYLRRKEVITIRLKAGESVFIDNNRILHGRGPIQEDSQRLIKRVWIKADN